MPGKKRQSGQTKKRTVMKLLPVRYQITLCYLGHERIPRNEKEYRCKYTVEPGADLGSAPFHERDPKSIPNIVKSSETDDKAKKAATPFDKGGDSLNPPDSVDKAYRIMIVDNHGMRAVDSNLLGQTPGDTESKVVNYQKAGGGKRDWLPDISPAVPFRIVVRKFINFQQVDFDKPHKIIMQIKDAVEESKTYDGARAAVKTFMEKFYKKHNRTSADPNVGDDNCPDTYKGKRLAAAGTPGVKAVDVIKKAPYKSKPEADVPPSDAAVKVEFKELTAATAQGPNNVEFALEVVKEGEVKEGQVGPDGKPIPKSDGFKIGVADFAFLPYPACGDNYRFLLWLVDSGGADVRDSLENGKKVAISDGTGDLIPKPRAYTTGRFIIWRRALIKLCVLINKTNKSNIRWDEVVTTYRRAFTDMIMPADPGGFFNLTAQQWITELKAVFRSDRSALNALLTAPAPNDLETVYARHFFPKPLTDKYVDSGAAAGGKVQFSGGGLNSQIFPMAARIIKHACENLNLLYPGSTKGKKQDEEVRKKDSEGFFVALMHNPSPTSNLLGSSEGDRMFWFCVDATPNAADIAITTQTFQHEMGHAQYLRHAHTAGSVGGGGGGGDPGSFTPTPPAVGPAPGATNIRLFSAYPSDNNQVIDHDQADAYDCTMSYTCSRLATPIPDFCAVCNLTLRFYDRVEMQKSANFGNQIMQGQSPVTIASVVFTAPDNFALTAPRNVGGTMTLPDLRVGTEYRLMAVGPEFSPTSNGRVIKARANLTIAPSAPDTQFWSKTGAGDLTITSTPTHYIKVRGVTAGKVTLQFSRSGLIASAEINVIP